MNQKYFFYRQDGILKRIDPENILFLEADDNYVNFFEPGACHKMRITLENALRLLPPNKFIRIHRSYAVALDRVEVIRKDVVSLTSIPGLELPVTKQHYELLVERIEILNRKPLPGLFPFLKPARI